MSDPILECGKLVTITVNQNEIPEIQELIISDTNLTIVLNNSTNDFMFSIDDENGFYQTQNTFSNIEPGIHTLYVKDIFDCTTISRQFFIIGFPKFFTPNDDGKNDTWNAKGLDPMIFPNTYIKIYDRYGKFISQFNSSKSNGWNGKMNGSLLTPNDYWYYLKLDTGEEYRGHFSLKI